MPRPAGARNHDFDEKRTSLLDGLTDFALSADLRRPSLRQFAIAVQQSEPTLRHYFTDRQGLIVEVIENMGRKAEAIWKSVAMPDATIPLALADYFRISDEGFQNRVFLRAHAFGIIEGMADESAGKAYLESLFEPALQSLVAKLRDTPGGTQDEALLRSASLIAFAPRLASTIHQEIFGGQEHFPIDAEMVTRHLERILPRIFEANER